MSFPVIIKQISIAHQDNSPVLLNEETREIVIGKIINRFTNDEQVVYYKYEFNANGTANIRLSTLTNETGFNLEVKKETLND